VVGPNTEQNDLKAKCELVRNVKKKSCYEKRNYS